MHDYTMNKIGGYIKENYCPEKMTRKDLEELYYWSKVMKNILEADKDYNIVVGMEAGKNNEEMEYDEFMTRFEHMYKNADATTRQMIKTKITSII